MSWGQVTGMESLCGLGGAGGRPQRMAHFLKGWFIGGSDFRVFLKDGFCLRTVIKISLKDCMAD